RVGPSYDHAIIGTLSAGNTIADTGITPIPDSVGSESWRYVWTTRYGFGWLPWIGITALQEDAMPIPGATPGKDFPPTDATGAPRTGASFAMSGRDPLGGSLTVPAPTHLGDGIYEVTYPTSSTDATGNYYVQAVADDALSQRFAFEWLVTAPGTAERWKPGDTLLERITVIEIGRAHVCTPVT